MTTPRTIPENPKPGERWAEQFRGSYWRVYRWQTAPSGPVVVADRLSEADARLLVEGPAQLASLRRIAGLMADPAINAAVTAHISERYKSYKPDSCGSAIHKRYETGDCVTGNHVVVEWSDKTYWFTPDGDRVEIDEYPSREAELRKQIVRLKTERDCYKAALERIVAPSEGQEEAGGRSEPVSAIIARAALIEEKDAR